MNKEKMHCYGIVCTLCGGTGNDPDDDAFMCPICTDGQEIIEVTEAEQKMNYPNAVKLS